MLSILRRAIRFFLLLFLGTMFFAVASLPKTNATSMPPYFIDCNAINYREQTIIESEDETATILKKFERTNIVFADKSNKDKQSNIIESINNHVGQTTNDNTNSNLDNIQTNTNEQSNQDELKQNVLDHQFEEVDEYLYVNTTTLNIRTGPGTNYNKVGTFGLNDKVHRVGVSKIGWSKIEHNDKELYVYSSYLSKEKVHVETVAEEMQRRGNIGRLKIPSVGINVAIFEVSVYNISQSQPIVDRTDSAAYMPDSQNYYGFILIGDHVNQGFGGIKKAVVGSTILEIDRGTNVETYMCVDTFIGYNGYGNESGLFDLNGNIIAGRNDGGLCLYTCNSDGTITITFWQ